MLELRERGHEVGDQLALLRREVERQPRLRDQRHVPARELPQSVAHIHFMGRYHFRLDETVAEGGLRSLRDPAQIDEFEPPSEK